jgi:hypothetical protein
MLHETRGSLPSELGNEAQIKVEEDCHDFA